MHKRCFKEDCQNKPIMTCSCVPNRFYMCSEHYTEHIESGNLSDHNIGEIYTAPNFQTKQIAIEKLSNIKEEAAKTIAEILKKSSELIQNIENCVEKSCEILLKLGKRCTEIIEEINSTKEISNFSQLNYVENLLNLKLEDAENILSDWKFPTLNFNMTKSLDSVKDLFNINFLSSLLSFDQNVESGENELLFFKCFSKELISVNVSSLKTRSLYLQLNEKINSSTCLCLLPDKSLFCYGNLTNEYSGATFIIETSLRVAQLPSGTPCTGSGAVYMKGCVYTFGGKNNEGTMKRAEKFNFIQNSWESLPSLPQSADFCSCVVFNEQILISGRGNNKIFSYNPVTNKYTKIYTFSSEEQKLLCLGNERVYAILSGNVIYESKTNDITKWHVVCEEVLNLGYLISYQHYHSNSVFFINHDYKLFRFDLQCKEVFMVDELSNV
ncbi:unnamed protein product [Blepharisma stoltei]|uniref:Uncharacterized protein n=1 Tax=Blepharisma stoltei TaxID=1481888 RepID=A0AAU9JG58_9CILI|nr:unnamed protein product [Blepharisma stoltei]